MLPSFWKMIWWILQIEMTKILADALDARQGSVTKIETVNSKTKI
jgi:hypothetical protein